MFADALISFFNHKTDLERARLLIIIHQYALGLLTRRATLNQVAEVFENQLPVDPEEILNHAFRLRQAGAWISFKSLLEFQPGNQPFAHRRVVLLWRSWTHSCTRRVDENIEPQPDPSTQQRLPNVVVTSEPSSQDTSSLPVDPPDPVDLDDTPSPSTSTGDATNSKKTHPSDENSYL